VSIACPVLDESWPVRYRFESASALHRHLAAGPFFIPDPLLPGEPGSRVIVEIGFAGGVEQSLVRGRLAARERDGVWLHLAFAHPTAWWDHAAGLPRRAQRRLGCDLFAEVKPQTGAPWFCRAVDLSDGGLRLATGPFQSLLPGDRANVTLMSGDPVLQPAQLEGRVTWAWGREAGLAVDELTVGLRALVAAVQWRWDEAREIQHGPGCHCCAAGQRQP
jgi:PilZ domain